MKQVLLFCFSLVFTLAGLSQNLGNLYTYVNKTGGYFHTVDREVLGEGNNKYQQQNTLGVVHTADDRGTAPVYAYYNSSREGHFYTINHEISDGDWGYSLQGVAFYAYKKKVPGTIAIHRYFHQEKLTHFYSTRFAKQLNGYGYEGIAFYIFPDEEAAKAMAKKEDAAIFTSLVTRPEYNDEVKYEPELVLADNTDETVVSVDSSLVIVDSVETLVVTTTEVNEEGDKEFLVSDDPNTKEFISIGDNKKITELSAEWRTVNNNKGVVITSDNRQVMTLIFPGQIEDFPPPGLYYFANDNTVIPFEARPVKVYVHPGYVSGIGGVLLVEHNNDKVWFILQPVGITVTNPKTMETEDLNFTVSVPVK